MGYIFVTRNYVDSVLSCRGYRGVCALFALVGEFLELAHAVTVLGCCHEV